MNRRDLEIKVITSHSARGSLRWQSFRIGQGGRMEGKPKSLILNPKLGLVKVEEWR